mmetsp:Transcript_64519/g.127451  ORF Transcript_64519/g.127451 Transcript_64519/m.127451 type:complete len:233 (+) Transcript_64519:394-1092(+)
MLQTRRFPGLRRSRARSTHGLRPTMGRERTSQQPGRAPSPIWDNRRHYLRMSSEKRRQPPPGLSSRALRLPLTSASRDSTEAAGLGPVCSTLCHRRLCRCIRPWQTMTSRRLPRRRPPRSSVRPSSRCSTTANERLATAGGCFSCCGLCCPRPHRHELSSELSSGGVYRAMASVEVRVPHSQCNLRFGWGVARGPVKRARSAWRLSAQRKAPIWVQGGSPAGEGSAHGGVFI